MMKKIIAIFLIIIFCFSFAGCASEEEKLNTNIEKLNSEITQLEGTVSELEKTRDALKNEITDIKVENGTAKYVLTLNIKQVHYSLDLTEHLKDSLNDVSIQIPVDKEYYDSVDVGFVLLIIIISPLLNFFIFNCYFPTTERTFKNC